jgi:medium-chain acyl-[acyl-carrier-protein] hydrolase
MSFAITEREYYIHYYEADYKKRCLITSMMNYFEDIALIQSADCGIGIDYLNENKLAWVLYKWDIKIKKYPLYKQRVKVRTWAYSFVKFYAYRQFEVIDENGETIVTANSVWLLVNTEKKRPVKINERMYEGYGADKNSADSFKIEKINSLSKIDSEKEFTVRYSDIDTNRHVNNVRYAEWSIETVPMDIVLKYELKRIKITYKKETRYGETIKVLSEIITEDGTVNCGHKIVGEYGNELCLAETVWEQS